MGLRNILNRGYVHKTSFEERFRQSRLELKAVKTIPWSSSFVTGKFTCEECGKEFPMYYVGYDKRCMGSKYFPGLAERNFKRHLVSHFKKEKKKS